MRAGLHLIAVVLAMLSLSAADARTPAQELYFAIEANDLEGVTELLDAGVDPNAEAYRERPLNLALRQRRERISWMLLERGADPQSANPNGDAALAFLSPHENLAQSRIDSGLLALIIYAANTRTICARELSEQTIIAVLERARDLDRLDSSQLTALMRASHCGHVNTLRALLAAGASLHTARPDGDTALSLAAASGATTTLQILLEAQAQMEHAPSAGLDVALRRAAVGQTEAHVRAAELLLAAGAEVNSRDSAGDTALIVAARGQNLAMAQLLIGAGADVAAVNNDDETAASVAHGAMREALRLGAR